MLQCAHDLATVDHEIENNGMTRNKVENERSDILEMIKSFPSVLNKISHGWWTILLIKVYLHPGFWSIVMLAW